MKITTKTAEISYDERGFLRINFLNNHEIFDLVEAQAQMDAGHQIMKGVKAPVLVDARDSFQVPSKEAKVFLAKNEFKTAEAILTNSLPQSVIGNFYMRLVKKSNGTPVKLFRDEEKAIAWLLKQK